MDIVIDDDAPWQAAATQQLVSAFVKSKQLHTFSEWAMDQIGSLVRYVQRHSGRGNASATFDPVQCAAQYETAAAAARAQVLGRELLGMTVKSDVLTDDLGAPEEESWHFDKERMLDWLSEMNARYEADVARVRARWPTGDAEARAVAYAQLVQYARGSALWASFVATRVPPDARGGQKRAAPVRERPKEEGEEKEEEEEEEDEESSDDPSSDSDSEEEEEDEAERRPRPRAKVEKKKKKEKEKKKKGKKRTALDRHLERSQPAHDAMTVDDAPGGGADDDPSVGVLRLADVAFDNEAFFQQYRAEYTREFDASLARLEAALTPDEFLLVHYRTLVLILFRPLRGVMALDAPLLSEALSKYVNDVATVEALRKVLVQWIRDAGSSADALEYLPSLVLDDLVRDERDETKDIRSVLLAVKAQRDKAQRGHVTLHALRDVLTTERQATEMVYDRANFFYFATLQRPWLQRSGGALFRLQNVTSRQLFEELTPDECAESLRLTKETMKEVAGWILSVLAGAGKTKNTPVFDHFVLVLRTAVSRGKDETDDGYHLRLNTTLYGIVMELLRLILAVASQDTLDNLRHLKPEKRRRNKSGDDDDDNAAAHHHLRARFAEAMRREEILPPKLRSVFVRANRAVIGTGVTFPDDMGMTPELVRLAEVDTGPEAVARRHPLLGDWFARFCTKIGMDPTLLMPAQLEALARWSEIELSPLTKTSFRGGIVVMEAGWGKTLLGLTASLFCDFLRGNAEEAAVGGERPTKTLIIGPNAAELSWCKDSINPKFFPNKRPRVYTFDVARCIDAAGHLVVVPYHSTKEATLRAAAAGGDAAAAPAPAAVRFDDPRVQFVFLPLEFFDKLKSKREGRHRIRALLYGTLFRRVILDESHLLTRRDRTRWVSVDLIPREATWALTATPFRTSAASVVAQLRLCGFKPKLAANWYYETMNRYYLDTDGGGTASDNREAANIWRPYAEDPVLFTECLSGFSLGYTKWGNVVHERAKAVQKALATKQLGLVATSLDAFTQEFGKLPSDCFVRQKMITLDELLMPFAYHSLRAHIFRPSGAPSTESSSAVPAPSINRATVDVPLGAAERELYDAFYRRTSFDEMAKRVDDVTSGYLRRSTVRTTQVRGGVDLIKDALMTPAERKRAVDQAAKKRARKRQVQREADGKGGGGGGDDGEEDEGPIVAAPEDLGDLTEGISFQGVVVAARLAAISMRLLSANLVDNVRATLVEQMSADELINDSLDALQNTVVNRVTPIDPAALVAERQRTSAPAEPSPVYRPDTTAAVFDPSSKYESALTLITEALGRTTPFRGAGAAAPDTLLANEPLSVAENTPPRDKAIVFCSWTTPLYALGLYLRDYAKWRPRDPAVVKLAQRFRKVDEEDPAALVDIFDHDLITYAYYDGHTSPKERQKLVELFSHTENNFRLLLVNLAVGGTSLNLQVANHAIFLNVEHQYYVQHQAERRINRTGQHKAEVFIRYIHSTGTIEDHVFANAAISKAIADKSLANDVEGQRPFYVGSAVSQETVAQNSVDLLATDGDPTDTTGPEVPAASVAMVRRIYHGNNGELVQPRLVKEEVEMRLKKIHQDRTKRDERNAARRTQWEEEKERQQQQQKKGQEEDAMDFND